MTHHLGLTHSSEGLKEATEVSLLTTLLAVEEHAVQVDRIACLLDIAKLVEALHEKATTSQTKSLKTNDFRSKPPGNRRVSGTGYEPTSTLIECGFTLRHVVNTELGMKPRQPRHETTLIVRILNCPNRVLFNLLINPLAKIHRQDRISSIDR